MSAQFSTAQLRKGLKGSCQGFSSDLSHITLSPSLLVPCFLGFPERGQCQAFLNFCAVFQSNLPSPSQSGLHLQTFLVAVLNSECSFPIEPMGMRNRQDQACPSLYVMGFFFFFSLMGTRGFITEEAFKSLALQQILPSFTILCASQLCARCL